MKTIKGVVPYGVCGTCGMLLIWGKKHDLEWCVKYARIKRLRRLGLLRQWKLDKEK